MKKYLLFLFVMVCALVCNAQNESRHIKFMNIPLTGSINNFQTKLAKKGARVSKYNKYAPVGIRIFDGVFAGNECRIYVGYNTSTKIVYRAKVIIDLILDKEIAEAKIYEFKKLIDDKYDTTPYFSGEQDLLPTYCYFVPFGKIDLFGSYDMYKLNYSIHIDYHDDVNNGDNNKSKMDDL